ncbi:thermonuclease family protein [Alphaproteobacteria bacterium]|nr:thermonuclease family protein [Alphaproteobacteria bacterium]MDB2522460.1 thermonuclease family protein [Alphaproteobacteria bacterium]
MKREQILTAVPSRLNNQELEEYISGVIAERFRLDNRARIWLDHLVETNIRVRGIDTPEIKRAKCKGEKAKGKAAKKKLAAWLADGVILYKVEYDKYGGRVLADVYTSDFKNVSLLMVDGGFARFYDGRGPRGGWCD